MTVLLCIISAVVAWGITLARCSAAVARLREQKDQEIQYWQSEAAKARMDATQAVRDAATWAAGHRQGRDDTIRIMPLIAAANERLTDVSPATDDPAGQT